MSVVSYCKRYKSPLMVLAIAGIILLVNFCYSSVKFSNGNSVKSDDEHIVHPKRRFSDDINFDSNGESSKSIIPAETLPQDSVEDPANGLSHDIINKVEKFVFFIGYPRSGHSIVGSFMDAHPHMVIAHEFMLFKKFRRSSNGNPLLQDKDYLFNALYRSSVRDSMMGWRSEGRDEKNYTLSVDSPWMGKYNGHISVIGDKSGGMTANIYIEAPEEFTAHYNQLQKTVGIPIKIIHCVRNPYDMVATNGLYVMGYHIRDPLRFVSSFKSNMSKLESKEFMAARFDNQGMLERGLDIIEGESKAVMKIIELVGADNVLELHNSELVNDPKSVLRKICAFLEVDCSEEYLQACSEKVFKSVSKSRDLVVWPPTLRNRMEDIIENYPFFHRYSFNSE